VIDHIVFATPDLEATSAEVGKNWGVAPTEGGRHTGRGTRNTLLGLGGGAYLEIIGPDREAPAPEGSRPFGIDRLAAPRLVTWAAGTKEIERRSERSRAAGFDPGMVLPMSRATPGGNVLNWKLTMREDFAGDGLVPFLIDWGEAPHPSTTSAPGCRLVSLTAEHPNAEGIRRMLKALEVDLEVKDGPYPRLVARIATPKGEQVLS
jgi:hypothetical protein